MEGVSQQVVVAHSTESRHQSMEVDDGAAMPSGEPTEPVGEIAPAF